MKILEGKTETVAIDAIRPHPKNVRQGHVGLIGQSLQAHGQYRPIVVQKSTGYVLAGNHTLKAAGALGWQEIEVTWQDVDDDEALRILLVDNKTNDAASYDDAASFVLLSTNSIRSASSSSTSCQVTSISCQPSAAAALRVWLPAST